MRTYPARLDYAIFSLHALFCCALFFLARMCRAIYRFPCCALIFFLVHTYSALPFFFLARAYPAAPFFFLHALILPCCAFFFSCTHLDYPAVSWTNFYSCALILPCCAIILLVAPAVPIFFCLPFYAIYYSDFDSAVRPCSATSHIHKGKPLLSRKKSCFALTSTLPCHFFAPAVR